MHGRWEFPNRILYRPSAFFLIKQNANNGRIDSLFSENIGCFPEGKFSLFLSEPDLILPSPLPCRMTFLWRGSTFLSTWFHSSSIKISIHYLTSFSQIFFYDLRYNSSHKFGCSNKPGGGLRAVTSICKIIFSFQFVFISVRFRISAFSSVFSVDPYLAMRFCRLFLNWYFLILAWSLPDQIFDMPIKYFLDCVQHIQLYNM